MNLLMVFAFAGDSTMTRFLAIVDRRTARRILKIPRARIMREGPPRPAALVGQAFFRIRADRFRPYQRRFARAKVGTADGVYRPSLLQDSRARSLISTPNRARER